MGRIVLAVVAGFFCMTVVVMASAMFAAVITGASLAPGELPRPLVPWFVANTVWSFGAAVAGGYVCSSVARSLAGRALPLLIALTLAAGAVTLLVSRVIPAWWTLSENAAGVAGLLLGYRLNTRPRTAARTT
jgi:hypothetical protein